ncbi:hypothetical protein HPP92_010761 [Vanilla planifolia]|uniref:Uncharacterized protein n=1 Tax=Vanilla planifolia TaxID=51239 RepID=A0A835V258_VANPL|nr:hypothetical protein HPP92_010761 [Vanilla planifolia]
MTKLCSAFPLISLLLFLFPHRSLSACDCIPISNGGDANRSLALKLIGIACILTSSAAGVLFPILGRTISLLHPDKDTFFALKSFGAGVILATALIHVLPQAFDRLTSPCLPTEPWHVFPFAGFVAMVSAMGTMMVDSFSTEYFKWSKLRKARPVDDGDQVFDGGHAEKEDHSFTHPTHEHSHGPPAGGGSHLEETSVAKRIRHRVISQTISHLMSKANFRANATVIMAIFFSLMTPFGVGVGIVISLSYDRNSSIALIMEGIIEAASAGILIYMSLINLLGKDFTNPRMQSSIKLQLGASIPNFLPWL